MDYIPHHLLGPGCSALREGGHPDVVFPHLQLSDPLLKVGEASRHHLARGLEPYESVLERTREAAGELGDKDKRDNGAEDKDGDMMRMEVETNIRMRIWMSTKHCKPLQARPSVLSPLL